MKKSKKKITNKERLRRTIQSQRDIQGYVAIGNINRNFRIGWNNIDEMETKEIKELIVQCVDECVEHELFYKDIFNEIYEYIDKWMKEWKIWI